MHIEIALLDEGIGPNLLHQLVFLDDMAVVLYQYQEGFERLGCERDRLAAVAENPLTWIQLKRSELVEVLFLLGHTRIKKNSNFC